MTLEEKKSAISNALIERKGLNYILTIAAELLKNPLFMLDLGIQVIGVSKQYPSNTLGWDDFFNVPDSAVDIEIAVEREGIYSHLMRSDEPIFGKFEFYERRFLGCRVRDQDGAIAFVVLIEETAITPEDKELLIFLCQTLFYEMLSAGSTAMNHVPSYGLICDCLKKRITEKEARRRARSLHWDLPEQMQMLALIYEENKYGLSAYYLQKGIASVLPKAEVIIYEEVLIIILSADSARAYGLPELLRHTEKISAQIGVSMPFSQLVDLPKALHQCHFGVESGRQFHPEGRLFFYQDYQLNDFFAKAARDVEPKDFVNPAVWTIRKYDQENGTSLEKTVNAYLEHGRNAKAAADVLFLHKNTLYYRLNRVEELCNISLENEDICFSLQLSYRLLQYHDPEPKY